MTGTGLYFDGDSHAGTKVHEAVVFTCKWQAILFPGVPAAQFGILSRLNSSLRGTWNGDGLIEGAAELPALGGGAGGLVFASETLYFWADLASAHLIEGDYTYLANSFNSNCTGPADSAIPVSTCLPDAKIGNGNSVYVWSGGPAAFSGNQWNSDGINYYGITNFTSITISGFYASSTTGMTVKRAYDIDKKADDGLPQSGNVLAVYAPGPYPSWAGGNLDSPPYTDPTAGSSTSCFDNANTSGAVQNYSVEISGGANMNCALSFKFQ
jgi:hypothetical protein